MTVPVYLGLGSNIGRAANIATALRAMEAQFEELRVSKIYENEAVGFEGPPFFNLVVALETSFTLAEVQTFCKSIEIDCGRSTDAARFSSKTLDIDILFYGDLVREVSEELPKLPRGEVAAQAYVLKPMAELSPYWQHPELKTSMLELWKQYQQDGKPNYILREVSLDEIL